MSNFVEGAAIDTPVNVAEFAVARETGILSSLGMGSCIAIMLWDAGVQLGAMAHVLLPHESLSRERGHPAKFASTAVPLLLNELRLAGGFGRPVAKIAGGASMFGALLAGGGGINMGERNIAATREALALAGIPLIAHDVGGDYGRSVYFDVATGEVRIVSIRNGTRYL